MFDRVSHHGFRLRLALVLTAVLASQALLPAQRPQTTTREDLQIEGKRELKNRYYEERRKNPNDPNFNSAEAKRNAYNMMRSQMANSFAMVNPWVPIGPAPVNNGQTPTSQPWYASDVTGRLTSIAIDETDDAVYVGGAQGGVWKTTDNGASWTAVSDDLASLVIGSIAIGPAPHAPGGATIYIGTGEGNGSCDSYGGVGIFKSTDSGATWSGPFGAAQFTNRGVNSIAVDRTDSDHLLATSASGFFSVACVIGPSLPPRGIYQSNDGGLTWSQVTVGNNNASVVIQDPVTPSTWWGALWFTGNGGHDGGLVRSTDNGNTWVQIAGTGGLPAVSSSWGRSWITATSDGGSPANSVLFLGNGIGAAGNRGRVYRSLNSGATWALRPAANGYCEPQCFYDMPVYVEPDDPNVVYTGGAGASSPPGAVPSSFMRSNNGGASFADKVRSADMTTALHADIHAIATWPNEPNRLWVANDGGIWRSDDRGDNWINVNSNLAITQFEGGDLDPADPNRAYGGTQDNGTMGWTGTDNWAHLDFGDGGFALIDQGNPNNLVHTYFNAQGQLIGVGYTSGGFATTMGFYSASLAPSNGINITDRVLFYAPIHLDRGATDTLYFGTHRLYRANTFFATPTFSVLAGGQDLASPSGALSAIETVENTATPGANANIIFTGSNNGRVHRSTNAGANFTQVDIGGSALYVSDILVDPANNNIVYQSRAGYAGTPGLNVRKSTDGGTTWAASGSGLPDIPVNALAIDPVVADRIWAGTDVGVYMSADAGATWAPQNTGMPNVAVFDLKANGTTETLVAFTHGRSAFKLDLAPPCLTGKSNGRWNLPSGLTNGNMGGYLYDVTGATVLYKISATLVQTGPNSGTLNGIIYDGLAPDPDYDVRGTWTITQPPGSGRFSARILLPGTNTVVGYIQGRFQDNPLITVSGPFEAEYEICP